ETGIADHDLRFGRAAFQKCEYAATREAQHLRVDLEERPRLLGLAVTGERADPQSDHADARFRTEQPYGGIEREPESRERTVVGRRLGAGCFAPVPMNAVQCRAMQQLAVAARRVAHRVDPEVAATAHAF